MRDTAMHHHRFSVLLILLLAAPLLAAPYLLKPPKLPGELISLRGIREVQVAVDTLPEALKNHHFNRVAVGDLFSERLRSEGLELIDDDEAGAGVAQIVVQFFTADDHDQPGAMALTLILALHQEVLVERLERRIVVPTSSMSFVRLTTREKGHEAARILALEGATKLSTVLGMATK